ncbi:type I-E CRISPR-associated protein Cas6/Cse3/CasE [Galbitalea sp. SE-J8]|uniref:type I-E CRISPR-associated protein Cas6/Cse3/CasE n=1 Tax=Galbitalea sp. SE-J8 TaxID=3054952 RepID=UPI00259D252B|nr:type I-E CRISPR-associated protein Cas6/Cse3/CasE [Galbitalea sp. SE-J8]MDM4762834.1 type I-E CRISPR-associated protein Cas6/Cse3/CasE [Galbitalea sp. SE-J8]
MSYLTRMPINAARRQARLLLTSRQAMHAAVLSGFAPGSGFEDERVLWRVDAGADRRTTLYIVSPERPDLTHLVEQAGWPTTSAWETREYDALLARLNDGQRWLFRLAANPVHTARLDDGRVKRLGHVTVAQQETWLRDRAGTSGFEVVGDPNADLLVSRRERVRFRRGEATVTLDVAQFDGQLVVTDAAALRHALVAGIGRAKGYGCGLLTLAPLSAAERTGG